MGQHELAVAHQYLARGELAAAKLAAELMLVRDPDDGTALHLAGLVAHQGGEMPAAVKFLENAAARLPHDANVQTHLGVALATAKNASAAEMRFRRALELAPDHADALYNLGNICHADGRHDEAVQRFEHNARLRPAFVPGIFNLANALRDAGKLSESAAAYEQALRLKPDYLKALNNLGNLSLRLGNIARATEVLERAVALRPDYAEAQYNLGSAYRAAGNSESAMRQFEAAIAANAAMPKAHAALADMFKDRQQVDEAILHYRQAIEHYVPPATVSGRSDSGGTAAVAATEFDLIRVWNNMGSCLVARQEFAEAEACFQYVLSLDANNPVARNNLGVIRMSQGRLQEATQEFKRAVDLDGRYSEAHSNLGATLQNQGFNVEAAEAYEHALALNGKLADARWNRSLLWLAAGDWQRGWPEFEWRWQRPDFCRQQFRCPLEATTGKPRSSNSAKSRQADIPSWDGSAVHGESVLLFSEQGLGDAIQFIRFAPHVRSRGGRVVVECPRRLIPLLQSCAGIDQWVAQGDELPSCNWQAPLMSLPAKLELGPDELSCGASYLKADAARCDRWRTALHKAPGFRIGINWQGNPTYHMDRYRSVPLAEFAPLARLENVSLIQLQQGFGVEQLAEVDDDLHVHSLGNQLDQEGAFVDTAAIIMELDLVVTSDTALAHLAGALGVPTWLVLPAVADWRWGLKGESCVWYPSMRVFRQRVLGQWDEVFERVVRAISTRSEAT